MVLFIKVCNNFFDRNQKQMGRYSNLHNLRLAFENYDVKRKQIYLKSNLYYVIILIVVVVETY